jgi:trans-2,3-dihydro-3-hydroxyanthranilate isomerase
VRVSFRLVDVFTDRPLAGNQLCVVPEAPPLPTEAMQAIANEIGFSETTFVTSAQDHRYHVRIFTPNGELPFAGHPTLGTAYVMVSEGRVSSPVVQVVAAGDIPVEVELKGDGAGFARMRQFAPSFGPTVQDREGLARALGLRVEDLDPALPPELVSTGFPQLMVPVATDEAVARVSPLPTELTGILHALGTDGCYVAHARNSAAHARFLGPTATTVEEDAATGAAVGPLGAYLVHHEVVPPGRITVTQGVEMGRPSTLLVDVEPDDGGLVVHVGGGVVRVGAGEFDLPV